MSGIDYKTIDFSEKLKEVSFASEEDLTNFLLVVAPRIEDNVATNRLVMMCCCVTQAWNREICLA